MWEVCPWSRTGATWEFVFVSCNLCYTHEKSNYFTSRGPWGISLHYIVHKTPRWVYWIFQICIVFAFPAIMCHSACNFMDLFKALCGVICEASFYRRAVCLDSTLATICYQRAKVRWRVLFRDYQVSDFILSSFCLATIQFYLFFYLYIATSLSLFLSLSLSISVTNKKECFFWILFRNHNGKHMQWM